VRSLGHALTPKPVGLVAGMPRPLRAGLLWAFSRTHAVSKLGEFGPSETRHLIDTMSAPAPGMNPRMRSLRA
jgi:2-dehydropantoate 2-reductase